MSIKLSDEKRAKLAGVTFSKLTERETIDYIFTSLDEAVGGHVITPNIDILRQLQQGDVHPILESASLVLADGAPIIWASRLRGLGIPGRITGADLIGLLSAEAAIRGRSVYILGGGDGVAERAREVLSSRHAPLEIVGTDSPPIGFHETAAGVADIREKLRQAAPDLVFVALGFPKQDRLAMELRTEFPGTWFVGCGAAIDFAAGNVLRAPKWIQAAGLEWSFRLMQEPRRLGRRYLIDDVPFAVQLLSSSAVAFARRKISRSLP